MKKMIVMLMTAVFMTAVSYALPNPVAWFDMADASDGVVRDASGNGHDLTLDSGCSVGEGGMSGKSLHYDGTTAARAHFSSPALGDEWSITMWYKTTAAAPAENTGNYAVLNGQKPGLLRYAVATRRLATIVNNSAPFSSQVMSAPGGWNHLAVVYSKTDDEPIEGKNTYLFSVYENGALVWSKSAQFSASDMKTDENTDVYLWSYNRFNVGYQFGGEVDEVKLFNSALTAADVLSEYEQLAVPERDALAIWPMTEINDEGGVLTTPNSKGGAPLTLTGCTLMDGPGGKKAIMFDGENGTRGSCLFPKAIREATIMAWVYNPPESTKAVVSKIFASSLSLSGTERLFAALEATTRKLQINVHGSKWTGLDPAYPELGQWFHFALVTHEDVAADGTRTLRPEWYLNGVKAGETSSAVSTQLADFTGDTTFYVGGSVTDSHSFLGGLSDVRIYGRALSPQEVRETYAGISTVDAGADFTVSREEARLLGSKGRNSTTGMCDGDVRWSLVSAPAGGASAVICNERSLVTSVKLPVDGDYVFRLTNEGVDAKNWDEVTVTRQSGGVVTPRTVTVAGSSTVEAPSGLALAATVSPSDDGIRFVWRKVSGPGGIWFEPGEAGVATAYFSAPGSYEIACDADDGAGVSTGSISVTVTGVAAYPNAALAGYWSFDDHPFNSITRNRYTLNDAVLAEGRAGQGVRTQNPKGSISAEILPNSETVSVSFWSYHDTTRPEDAATTYVQMFATGALSMQYNASSLTAARKTDYIPFSFKAVGADNSTYTWTFYPLNQTPQLTMTNEWTHFAFVFDQSDYSGTVSGFKSRLRGFANGCELTVGGFTRKDSASVTTANDAEITFSRKAKNAAATTFAGVGSDNRYFPGVVDEIRYYTNTLLTAGDVARLVSEPRPMNRAPIVELGVETTLVANKGETITLSAAVYDDGDSSEVLTRWEQLSGPVALQLPTGLTGAVTFPKAGTYEMRVLATDGEQTASSDVVTVMVRPSGLMLIFL